MRVVGADRDGNTKRGDERIRLSELFACIGRRRLRGDIVVHLRDIEQRERAGDDPAAGGLFHVLLTHYSQALPEDSGRAALAFPHLGTHRLPLAITTPQRARKALRLGCHRERHAVYAPVALSRDDIRRTHDCGALMMPGHAPLTSAGLDGGDDLRCDAAVDVGAVRFSIAVHRKVSSRGRVTIHPFMIPPVPSPLPS